MHLDQELVHVRTGPGRKNDEVEDDALHLGLHESQLVLEQLEQDVVLVQVLIRLEVLQVRVDEVAEEQEQLERNGLLQVLV